jgi:hypothetical protein
MKYFVFFRCMGICFETEFESFADAMSYMNIQRMIGAKELGISWENGK